MSEIEAIMHDVELVTGGYLTEEARFSCKALEKFATLQSPEKVMFYVNEKEQVFSIHFAHALDLQHTICAIDHFPGHTTDNVVQAANQLQAAMKQYWQNGTSAVR